ncbi:MAG: class I SAM-dependent methyltransferase [Candidatus Methanomethylicaceae archaeon]
MLALLKSPSAPLQTKQGSKQTGSIVLVKTPSRIFKQVKANRLSQYQKGFYQICPRVRDPYSRREKARKILQLLIQYAGFPLSSAACLDVGCSSGIISYTLAPFFQTVVGLEYDETALCAADPDVRKHVQFVLGDAMHLPFKDDAFEVIICAQVYEHVPDDRRLFDEIHRVLKGGGVVFFSGPNWLFPIEPHYRWPFLHWLPLRLADAILRFTGLGTHYYERSRSFWSLRRLMRSFVILDVSKEVIVMKFSGSKLGKLLQRLPETFWRIASPFYPNFNWILKKGSDSD